MARSIGATSPPPGVSLVTFFGALFVSVAK